MMRLVFPSARLSPPPRASTATGVDACFAPGFVEFDAFSS